MAKTRDQLEQPFEAWVAERRAILVNQRAFVGQPARVKTKDMFAKNFMVYPVYLETRRGDAEDPEEMTLERTAVQRRYSEFEELREIFLRRFGASGMLIPPLPPKSGFGTGEKIVRRRVRALSLFCAGVLDNVFLASDGAWTSFLTPGATVTSASGEFGQLRWTTAVSAAAERRRGGSDTASTDALADVAACGRELDGLDAALKKASAQHEAFAAALEKAAAAADDFRGACASWGDAEASTPTVLRAASSQDAPDFAPALPADEPAAEGSPVLATVHTLTTLARRTLGPLPDASRALLGDVVDYELAQARELRDMCKRLADLRKGVASAEDKAARARASDMAKTLAELNDVARDRKAYADDYESGLVEWSLPNFARRRKRALEDIRKHGVIVAGALGAPGCEASPHDVAAATRVLLALTLDVPFLRPAVSPNAPPPPPDEDSEAEV